MGVMKTSQHSCQHTQDGQPSSSSFNGCVLVVTDQPKIKKALNVLLIVTHIKHVRCCAQKHSKTRQQQTWLHKIKRTQRWRSKTALWGYDAYAELFIGV